MANVRLRAYPKESGDKGFIKRNEFLNLPDLQFFLWCQHHYKLNRGVYNTIDAWLYDYGIVPVIHRRIYILAFLDFVKEREPEQDGHKFIRFGNGGLVRRLTQFMNGIETTK